VAAIDLAQVRAERQGSMGSQAAAGRPPAPAGAPPHGEPPRECRPFYKQWWFWVVAGVGVIVLISVATSDSRSGDDSRARLLDPQSDANAEGGPVLLRF
jgi:hypothetical protein